jgi:L-seryl-tRNA(Ser) seleniumtransferase
MPTEPQQQALKQMPPVTELLKTGTVAEWLRTQPQSLVTACLRGATARVRQRILETAGDSVPEVSAAVVLSQAGWLLEQATTPHLRKAINATGVILHTGLGRAVFPTSVVDSIVPELKGYSTLAVDRETNERIERDELVEHILTELTGAEAATVVNNNAAATMLVLAALASRKEVVVSRGQLIEIGGSFRLPEVMAQSGARLVEVGATNRTHLRDYRDAITPETAALMRVHPSNYRVVGFTSSPSLMELADLAHSRGLILVDDLGAGALVELEQFGLPHEPTVRESIEAGADIVLFSGDKLIGAAQSGIIVGKKDLIARLRKHPLMRAVRVDKTCLMVLERTLHLFRDVSRLRQEHPLYRTLALTPAALHARAETLQAALQQVAPAIQTDRRETTAYLGSGSLPTQALPSVAVAVSLPGVSASELARRFRQDAACVFGRIENDLLLLDVRTVTEAEIPQIAAAARRIGT